MASNRGRIERGRESQSIVANWFVNHGWPFALSTGAARSGTDVTGMPGIDVEVKARAGLDLNALLRQMIEREQEGLISIGVIRPAGYGPENIDYWPVIMTLEQATRLLALAGYGEGTERDEQRVSP